MPSPFPGMDPYLESSGLWQDVHYRLIFCAAEMLQVQLPPRYYALIEERIILEVPSRSYYPDVTIVQEQARRLQERGAIPQGDVTVTGVVEADVAIEVEDDVEMRQGYLEIREESGGQVVTVIEVISPVNKAVGSRAHQTHLRKQVDVLASSANLVEIDLLRRGTHILAVPESRLERVRPFDYLICVHRAARHGIYQLYPRTVRQPLPRLAIPLGPHDSDVVLDLQVVFQRCYDSAPYARLLDYRSEPRVSLSDADAAWADTLLHERGLR